MAANVRYEPVTAQKESRTTKESSKRQSRLPRTLKAWILLSIYTAGCIGLSGALIFGINGYEAVGTPSVQYSGGKLMLRVSDITTLVSTGLVIIKFFLAAWSAIAVWRCAYFLAQDSVDGKRISFMTKYKLPPWMRWPFQKPEGWQSWMVSLVLLCILPQAFISPLLSGAVDWNPSSIASGASVEISSTWPNTNASLWYWYNAQGSFDKRPRLRQAAGFAALAWGNGAVSPNGTSLTGNGCRHVVNDKLPVNSTLANATLPCIRIDSISWTMIKDVPHAVRDLVGESKRLSLVDDDPRTYYYPGVGVLFDINLPYHSGPNSSTLPTANLFSGNKTLGLEIARPYDGLYPFGNLEDTQSLEPYIYNSAYGNSFLIGNVTLTAGVTTSALSTYISSRVVEDQTPMDEVVFEPNIWVNESIWLLPDLMTMIAVMNASLIPTWHNIDGYAENLIRQAYLSAWDMYHSSYDTPTPANLATPREQTLRATVSFVRVFAWLGISLLLTLGGGLLVVLGSVDPEAEGEYSGDQVAEAENKGMDDLKDDVKSLLKGLNVQGFLT